RGTDLAADLGTDLAADQGTDLAADRGDACSSLLMLH
ncbi:hypothetical protein PAT3040_06312, partial [Paenibacillus agaridevorans]